MVECHQILDEAFCNQLRHRYSYGADIGIPIRFQLVELFLVCRGYFRSSSGHRRFVRFLSRSHFLRRHVLRLEQGKPSFSSGFHLDGIHRFQHFRFVDPGSECVDAKPGRHGIQPDDSPQRNVGFLGGTTYTLSACFVVGVSAWFILKKRHFEFARKSILLASVFGFLSIIATIFTGDTSAQDVTRTQPMKLAAMEGLNEGGKGAPFTLIGLTCTDPQLPSERMKTVKYGITIPKLLSFLGYHDFDAYVPGIQNIMDGYTSEDGKVYPSIEQRMANGRLAIDALKTYKQAVKDKDDALASQSLQTLRANFRDFGYGYLSSPYDTIPPVPLVFYSFRLMVGLGMLFVLLFICSWWYAKKRKFEKFKFIPYLAIACVPLAYIASQCGWIVAEVGRQPWVVQNLMPTNVAITRIASGWVVTTFWMFAILFTLLLIAEIGIMFTQIRKGVKE